MNATGTYYKRCRGAGREAGATLLIVLVILSILALIATTLSFTSRLEVISSANFAEGLQARMSAATGVQASTPLLPQGIPYAAYSQRWAVQTSANFADVTTRAEGVLRAGAQGSNLADIVIEDESAKVNINASSEEFLKNAFASILKSHQLSPAPAASLAKEIVAYRLGPDGKPGVAGRDDDGDSPFSDVTKDGLDNDHDGRVDNPEEALIKTARQEQENNQSGNMPVSGGGQENVSTQEGVDEPDEFIPDPSRAPNGDDRPFLSLAELHTLPSITNELYEALTPYLTVYSTSEPVYSLDGRAVEKVDANTATAQEIYEALLRRFPDRQQNLLKQFAVNIVDARDADSIPTQLPGDSSDYPILGIEKTPYINEVWSDSVTDEKDGDDGQYVELFNPYDEDIAVDGWEVEVGGSTVLLNGQIAAKGYIVVTDDYNNQNDPNPEDIKGYGSLYDIFGVVQGGSARRIIEKRDFNIPNDSGIVHLRDREGHLIDYFSYSDGTFRGVKKSFQRDDPRVRLATWAFCTPLNTNPPTLELRRISDSNYQNSPQRAGELAPFKVRDRLFESPVDLMEVFAGYSSLMKADTRALALGAGRTWALPVIDAAGNNELDLRLVDIFTVRSRFRLGAEKIIETLGRVDEDDLYRLMAKDKAPEYDYGRLNLNTVSREVLWVVPGFEPRFIDHVEQYCQKVEQAVGRGEKDAPAAPFENVTDVARLAMTFSRSDGGLKEASRQEILERLRVFLPYVTVSSTSFMIYSENHFRSPRRTGETPEDIRNPARSTVRALIQVMPGGAPHIIDWCYLSQ
jgi:type II secretory pathway component PulK